MQSTGRTGPGGRDLQDFRVQRELLHGGPCAVQRLHSYGVGADEGAAVFLECRLNDGPDFSSGSADEDLIRHREVEKRLWGVSLHKRQVPGAEFAPVLLYELTGLGVSLYSVDPALRGGQCQFHADAAGAGSHVPDHIVRVYSHL